MKILVAYISFSGNTKKVAEAMFLAIEGEKEMRELKEVCDTSVYDLIFLGFPVHGFGGQPAEVPEFINKYCAGKKIALFITHGAPEDSPFIAQWLEGYKKLCSSAQLLGIFHCQGKITQEELDKLLNSPDPEWRQRGQNMARAIDQPDASSLQRVRTFTKEIINDYFKS
jgi:flavodoxin